MKIPDTIPYTCTFIPAESLRVEDTLAPCPKNDRIAAIGAWISTTGNNKCDYIDFMGR
ncbi:MAG: hypothetical protein IBX40_10630 [Methanosarcinales archaeon]|nr:hypothetical protein [Methanosarcinales archaeon]